MRTMIIIRRRISKCLAMLPYPHSPLPLQHVWIRTDHTRIWSEFLNKWGLQWMCSHPRRVDGQILVNLISWSYIQTVYMEPAFQRPRLLIWAHCGWEILLSSTHVQMEVAYFTTCKPQFKQLGSSGRGYHGPSHGTLNEHFRLAKKWLQQCCQGGTEIKMSFL